MNTYRRATYTAGEPPAARPARPLSPGTYVEILRGADEHRRDRD
jgi:hypothetical protein